MKLIILRGLPGCGKSTIAEYLSKKLGCDVIYGDFFKREFVKNNTNFKSEDIYNYAHNKILEELENAFNEKKEVLIIEELFENKNFVEDVKSFCNKNKIEIKWFYIQRDLEKLLETENNRERKVKNTLDDFKKLKEDLDSIKNEWEIKVDNNGIIEESVSFILEKLQNKQ